MGICYGYRIEFRKLGWLRSTPCGWSWIKLHFTGFLEVKIFRIWWSPATESQVGVVFFITCVPRIEDVIVVYESGRVVWGSIFCRRSLS